MLGDHGCYSIFLFGITFLLLNEIGGWVSPCSPGYWEGEFVRGTPEVVHSFVTLDRLHDCGICSSFALFRGMKDLKLSRILQLCVTLLKTL